MADVTYIKHISAMLLKIASPMLLLFGCLGNVMSIIVMTRPESRRRSTAIYLTALSTTDLLVLCIGMPRLWIRGYSDYDIRALGDVICKAHAFSTYVLTQYSSWLVVVVTLERVIMVWYPIRVRLGCTVKSASVVVVAVGCTLFIANSHILYTFQVVPAPVNTTYFCGPPLGLEFFYFNVWPWVDLMLLFLIPFLIICIGNVLIVMKIYKSKLFQRRSTHILLTKTKSSPSNRGSRTMDQEPLSYMTTMLLTLNLVFLILVSPVVGFMVSQCGLLPNDSLVNKADQIAICELVWDVVNVLMYTNYTVNFVLYMMCGARFRTELKKVLFSWRKEQPVTLTTASVVDN